MASRCGKKRRGTAILQKIYCSFHPLFYFFNTKTDLILCVHSETKKSPPRTTTLITSLEMFPSFWRRLVTGGEIDPIFARRHIRHVGTYKEELIEKEASLGTLYELFKSMRVQVMTYMGSFFTTYLLRN